MCTLGGLKNAGCIMGLEIIDPVFEAELVTLRDGREVVVREGVPGDAAAVLAYMNRCLPDFSPYVATAADEFTVTEDYEREWLQTQQRTVGAYVVLAFAGDQVVGLLNCAVNPNRSRLAHIGQIGMSSDKAYWGSGLGSAMMKRMVQWAEASPALGMLQLQVYADNERAMRLYKGHGFVTAGTIPGRTRFADGSTRDDVIMYRRVDGTLSEAARPGDFYADLGDGAVLRQLRYGDAEVFLPIFLRNYERLSRWFRWEPGIRGLGDVRAGFAEWIEEGASIGGKSFVLEVGGEAAGLLFYSDWSRRDNQIEMGYWLDGGYEGRGLATRACRALLRHAFEKLDMNRVDITAGVENTRSRALAERLGMTQEGVFKQWQRFPDGRYVDVARYALMRKDWKPEAQS